MLRHLKKTGLRTFLNRNFEVVVADIDGTITDEKRLLDLNAVKIIRELEKKLIKVCLATGNALPLAIGISGYIGASGPVIGESGGAIWYRNQLHVLSDINKCRKALTILKEKLGEKVREKPGNVFRVADLALERNIEIRVIRDNLIREVKALDSKYAYHLICKGVDKGIGLKKAMELAGIPLEKVVVIGDSELDIDMFRVSGYSISLANSPKKVKEASDYTTMKPYGEGFCEAIKHVFSLLNNKR